MRRIRSPAEETARMVAEVREGLTARPLPWLPCKYFYDDRGSRLFEEITRLPEYYQTRTEERLLEAVAEELVETTRPRELFELGSGSGRKIRLLLDAMARRGRLESCLLLDINERDLSDSLARLSRDYPGIAARGIVGDFAADLACVEPRPRRLALFLAGTIGNLHPDQVPPFLAGLAGTLLPGDGFVVGIDRVKEPERLEAAYNDAAGVTALFNLNILRVLNDRLGADFDLEAFEHVAFYDRERAWIEMRLKARRSTRVRILAAGLDLRYAPGNEIRTELSCKYTRSSLEARLAGTGFRMRRWFTDQEDLFALALLERTTEGPSLT